MYQLSDQFELRLATEKDAEQILKIYECGEFKGKISVLYTRRPNPYLSLLEEGDQVIMPVIYDLETDVICAVGCCVVRRAFIQGEIKNVAYLTGLKILPEYRKRVPYIAKVYQFLYEQTKEIVDFYYTTILLENVNVQKMLEKKRKNMPTYNFKGNYTVYCFKTGKKRRISSKYKLECGNKQQALEFYKKYAKQWELFNADFNLDPYPQGAIYTLIDSEGEILAACIIQNQQAHKQYIVTGYQGLYNYLELLPMGWLGYPNFPKTGEVVNYASYYMLCIKDGDIEIADYFISKIAELETRYDILMLGLFETHPYVDVIKKVRHIKYQSRFYTVYWKEENNSIDYKSLHIDVGSL